MTPVQASTSPIYRSRHEDKVLLVLTLIIGAIVSLAVVAFILLTENLGSRLYPAGGAAWRRVLVPVVGALSTGFLLYRYFPNARGSGIPQTKAALFLRDGYISFRTVLGKFGLCSVSLASGIALGREGPAVQVGAGIASTLGRRLGLTPSSIRSLVPAGASAALAAAFNTPISAVLFSLEEVMGDMHAPVLGSIVLSSATSWIVLHLLLGDEPLFHVPAYQLVHPVEFIFYAVLGVAGGLVSVAFVKALLWQRKFFLSVPASRQWFLPAVGGLTVGLLGWFYPQVLGVGYGFVGQALNGQIALGVMAVLVFLKLVATSTCYASGNAGGIFGPSLFIGAMMGGSVGGVAHLLAPDYTASVGAYALVGMGAAFAGIVRVPMTSVIMIFEITRDYSIIVPLMIANLISYFLSSKLQEEPIYEALQHQDGVHLPSEPRLHEEPLKTADAFRTDIPPLASSDRIGLTAAWIDRERGAWPVVDVRGLRGMLTLARLDEAMENNRSTEPLSRLVPDPGPNELLTGEGFPHVHADHPLEVVMRRMAETGLPVLPVVSRGNIRELHGTISTGDIIAAYGHGPLSEPAAAEEASAAQGLPNFLLRRVLASLAALIILGGLLNYFYRSERIGQAQAYYRSGNNLMSADRFEEASEQYRKALSISHNADLRLALGLALEKAGSLSEASTYLNEVLREQPQSGPANLGLAHVLTRQGKLDDAVLRYQRAATGTWPSNPKQNRLQSRLDLVQALSKAGRTTQAKAELLSMVAQMPEDAALQKQLSVKLADFGLLKESADMLRDVVQHNPEDVPAYQALADTLFRMGDYAGAEKAFRGLLRIEPSNQTAARRASASASIVALDPTLRGLSAAERFRRSREIVKKAMDGLTLCAGSRTALPPAAQADTRAAKSALGRPVRASLFNEKTESNLVLAERLWAESASLCRKKTGNDDPFGLLMAKLNER